jgi:hypothetical protein
MDPGHHQKAEVAFFLSLRLLKEKIHETLFNSMSSQQLLCVMITIGIDKSNGLPPSLKEKGEGKKIT